MDVKKPNTGPPSEQLNLPAGFRFHPTDEELVVNYLVHKSESRPFPIPIVAEVNLYKFDPWELPEKALFGEREWYFFSPRDRKYPNGARPNRAAASGYWKATGTDKPINSRNKTVGVKKALVFYKGKAPKGIKTNWIMHEYRLAESKAPLLAARQKGGSLRLDDWVLCRIYKKSSGAFKVMMSTTPKSASGMKEEPEEDQLDEVLASLPDIDTNNSRFKMPNFAIGGGGGGSAAVRNSNINNSFFGSSPVFEEMFGSEPEDDTSENATSGSFEHQQQQQQQQAMSFHPSPSFDTTATTTMDTIHTNHHGYGGFQGTDNATANTMVMINKVNPWAYETIYQQQLLQQQQQQQQVQQQQEFHSHRVISPPPMKLEKIPSNVSDILLQIQQQNAMCKKRSRREDEDDVQSTCRSPITRAMRQGFGFDLTHPMRYSS